MKAVDYIQKFTDVRENNSLNENDTKTVKVWIADLAEFGDEYLDDDAKSELGKFFSKFPDKPKRVLDRSKGKPTNAGQRMREIQQERYNPNGRQFTLDGSRMQPRKKKLEVEGIILEQGDEITDKSSGKIIVYDSFENRPEGVYILGTVMKNGEPHQFHRDNAHKPVKRRAAVETKAKEEQKQATAAAKEAEKQANQAEKAKQKAEQTQKESDKKEADKQAKEAKNAQKEAEKQAMQAEKAKVDAEKAKANKAKDKADAKADKAKPEGKKDADKPKSKPTPKLKKGAYVEIDSHFIRVSDMKENGDSVTIMGADRTGKEITRTIKTDQVKLVKFEDFKTAPADFKGKNVPEISEEVRILNAFLEVQEKPSEKLALNLHERIHKFAAEYLASSGSKKNEYRVELGAISNAVADYLNKKTEKLFIPSEDTYTSIVEKSESERVYETVRVVKYFSTWAKRDKISPDNIKELQNRISLAKKRKEIKASNPLYSDVNEIEKILISMSNGGSYSFPDLGLGDVSFGLAGSRKMIRDWSKNVKKNAKKIVGSSTPKKKTPAKKEESSSKKGFFSRIFGK